MSTTWLSETAPSPPGSGAAPGSAKTPGPWRRPSPTKGEPIPLRRIFVWSSADAGAAAVARAKKLDRARVDLDALRRGLGSRHYPRAAEVNARLAVIAAKRRVGDYLRHSVGTDAVGKPTLEWHFDEAALDHEATTPGWYCLLTNLDPAEADSADVLVRYKGQEVIERRYGNFKGPLAVAPLFLKNNRRIEALLSVICLALLIFCLVEREVRHAIAPELTMTGFPGRPKARPPAGSSSTRSAGSHSSLRPLPGHPSSPPRQSWPAASSHSSISTPRPPADQRSSTMDTGRRLFMCGTPD